MVVSHACVVAANQAVYAHLASSCDVTLVVPATWRDELRREPYPAQRWPGFAGEICAVRTLGRGRPQRHLSLLRPGRALRSRNTEFLILEEEPFSLQSLWWASAARRAKVPYAVQVAENLPRDFPAPVRWWCRRVLSNAAFILARSPQALLQAQTWGFRGPDAVVPHGVEGSVADAGTRSWPVGVVGFVGRLVEAKGVEDVIRVLRSEESLSLRVAGDGPLKDRFDELGDRVELLGTLEPEAMVAFYATVSVVVVPSRTTPTWSEQFGRVVIEAQDAGVPVVAYDSGEIPWVSSLTSAVLVPEGDVAALRVATRDLACDEERGRAVGERGAKGVRAHFTNDVIAASLHDLIDAAISRAQK